ncbi:hypothetical protein [Haloactinopolyspora sp.]|uniref:hypothetical protein n=1 Tax=Haloactinopolyspora sp. TaxID=1966353 RepID=UPI002605CBF9|nr:hypothetical protein [Haloactinopolyspora sp.]
MKIVVCGGAGFQPVVKIVVRGGAGFQPVVKIVVGTNAHYSGNFRHDDLHDLTRAPARDHPRDRWRRAPSRNRRAARTIHGPAGAVVVKIVVCGGAGFQGVVKIVVCRRADFPGREDRRGNKRAL